MTTGGRYDQVVREDHPFAYYKMDDVAVGDLYDSTGNGHSAFEHFGSPTRGEPSLWIGAQRDFFTDASFNPPVDDLDNANASTYFGDSSFGSHPQMYHLDNNDGAFSSPQWSMEFLCDIGSGGSRCFYQHDNRIRMELDGGQLRIYFWNVGMAGWTLATPSTGDDFPDHNGVGQGQHIVITFDGSQFLYYVKGLDYGFNIFSDGSFGGASTPFPVTAPLPSGLGDSPYFGNHDGNDVLGHIDELAFYDYVLSPERIFVHWAGLPIPASALLDTRVRFRRRVR